MAGEADAGSPNNGGTDPCAMDPCINGGVCSAEGDEAVCACGEAYAGEHCEQSVDDCAGNPCQNAGTCIDGSGTYTCSCPAGFSGEHCERAVSDCQDDPCLNDGTCVDKAGSYECTCLDGFSGTNCELDVDECAGNPCKNGAQCVDGANAFTCECKSGYTGTTCQTNIDDCANEPCQNGGSCADGVNTHTCTCTNRYTGTNCEYLEVKLAPTNLSANSYTTEARALSNDGKVLLFHYSEMDTSQRRIGRLVDFDAANLMSLSYPVTEYDASGYGIDHDGATIVGASLSSEDNVVSAFKHVGASSSVFDTSQLPYNTAYHSAVDVSADGATAIGNMGPGSGIVIGFYCKGTQACKQVPVDGTGWLQTGASAVNGDGSVIVGWTVPTDHSLPGTAWRWSTSTAKAKALTVTSAAWTLPRANGVSRDGLVVVGEAQVNGVSHAVRWSGASLTPTDLGTGTAKGTSANGSVTVGVDNSNVPLVWLGTTRQTLASLLGTNPDLAGATLTELVAVSDDGKVVGGTATVGGAPRAFMARLP